MTEARLYLSDEPGPMLSLVRMPDGTAFEGAGNGIEEAEADARARWEAWKAAGGVARPRPAVPCRVYWGSHGCMHERGHDPEIPHECDCCECENHPDPDSGCVARPPHYGERTRFYGEDAEALGLPLV